MYLFLLTKLLVTWPSEELERGGGGRAGGQALADEFVIVTKLATVGVRWPYSLLSLAFLTICCGGKDKV